MEGRDEACRLCGSEFEGAFWICETCPAALCEPCFFEEGHGHKMVQNRAALPDRVLFQYQDPITLNSVYLGNCVGAAPGSHALANTPEIRFVLTLIDLGPQEEGRSDGMEKLRSLYADKKATVEHGESGVRYHLIPMPDVLSPERLPPGCAQVLEEATCFIDAALQKGSVLVHCQKGEKRSPTVVLAWMLTRGVKVNEAVDALDKGYRGKPGWGEVYKRTRKDWIEELKKWSRTWRERQKTWSESVVVERRK